MKQIKIIMISILFLGSTLEAQNKWSAEFRPGINFPAEDFKGSNIETGFGFEVTVGYRFMEHLHTYLGWGNNTFSIEDSNMDFEENGYTFGLQFIHPLWISEDLSYLFRLGAIYNHLKLEDVNGELIDDSGHGLGWQIETGLDYVIGSNWSLRPSLRYRSLSRDIDVIQNQTISMDLNYLSFGLGVSKSF
ncbi:outer membrane beta-barrel protein [Mariniflexile soesokkakense]|uniref:Outer membrane beta-barrel protein n=1 Tax=Mariniflexile soesokkakense TaxID=1343160 RepID=A0ABV0AFM7_9FLAO